MAKQDSKSDLAGLLSADRERVVDQWIDSVVGSLKGRISKAEVDRELRELYAALEEALASGSEDARGENLSETRALLTELSRNRARQGFTPSETAISVLALKKAFEPALRDGTAEDTDRYLRLSRVLDDLALFTIETYTRTREEIISSQAAQLMELSTPVVKLWDGVIAVPLVGTLDSARTQVVMEKLLQALVDTGSEQAIIDITGVPAVDTQVAQHLLKTIVAARLMGAECTVSGIRPQIAQTIVALGIEFGDIVTKATLADALQLALRKSGIDLVAHQGGGR
ncbi:MULTISPECIES: STAS domain-containing protein [unclassified Streptomyces]|uniref:STAS domain-containing protein n=1 Tax=unclassified Streptomyces TaxID=2593676 RepID=UPI00081E3B3A|nr:MULTISPECIES: STAS domain-containing protein [unclassified Streptomyces]MYR95227.1 STAS domain-containing protein [Streptomyces sp. SID4937]SCD86207.1 rsbT co-antagonist protein RsbR [Streptomyces sp. ScaeMP-e83]